VPRSSSPAPLHMRQAIRHMLLATIPSQTPLRRPNSPITSVTTLHSHHRNR
jgi:hypothetical protein